MSDSELIQGSLAGQHLAGSAASRAALASSGSVEPGTCPTKMTCLHKKPGKKAPAKKAPTKKPAKKK